MGPDVMVVTTADGADFPAPSLLRPSSTRAPVGGLAKERVRIMANAYVGSEVGQLKRVILHRPGRELARLTPANKERLLFDEVPWVSRAQEEHDEFAEVLRGLGVEVLLLDTLLEETLVRSG